jgi:transcriptional regulator with XRE-family HTH domain
MSSPADLGWCTPRELAARCGVSRTQVWRWERRGIVEVERLGPRRQVRVRLLSVQEQEARARLSWPLDAYGQPVPPASDGR